MNAFTKILGTLFGGGKGVVEQVSDVVDKWRPSPTTEHDMAVEDSKISVEEQTAGDASQNSARAMTLPGHASGWDVLVDGLNRMVRPVTTYWILGGLSGFWPLPRLGDIDPMMGNIVWTVITFWFGSRMLFKDMPNAYALVRRLVK